MSYFRFPYAVLFAAALCAPLLDGQGSENESAPAPSAAAPQTKPEPDQQEPVNNRVFGVLPNYRTADGSQPFQPISCEV